LLFVVTILIAFKVSVIPKGKPTTNQQNPDQIV